MQRLTARWIVPVDQPPIPWGAIEIDGERIHAIGSAESLTASRPEVPTIDLGEAAILPGLVNAHTHLEFSDLAQPIRTGPSFADWIDRIVQHRRERGTSDAAMQRGLDESLAAGVTTLGEIVTSDDWRSLVVDAAPGVVFREIIGLLPARWDAAIDTARRHLEDGRSDERGRWIRGLSPHAPYSVHPRLYEKLIDLAIAANAPVAVHLAETREELELLEHARGPLVDELQKLGAWQPGLIPRGSRVLDYLMPLADVDRGLVVHGNYLSDDEIEFLSRHRNLSVVYCPRTHAAFGHPPHSWRELLAAGVRVGLGTDSRASNPDLSLWNEVRFLKERFPRTDAGLLIKLATLNGAEALGCEAHVGSLTRGKLANLVVLRPLESSRQFTTAEDYALSAETIAGVMQAGQWATHLPPAGGI